MKCTDKEWKYCNEEKMGCEGCAYYDKTEEINKVLEELSKVRPERLDKKAKELFEAIIFISDNENQMKANLHIMEHIIVDLLDSISKDTIKKEIQKLKEMHVEGEVFTTAVNFAIKELESLL